MKKTTMMLLLLAGCALFAPFSVSAAPAELDVKVERALFAYEPLNLGRELVELGQNERVAQVLLRLAKDDATRGILRLRAIEALGYVPTEAGRSYLHELVATNANVDDSRVYVLAAALRALSGYGAQEVSHISPALFHGSPDVREAAARALVRCGRADEVRPLLQRRLALESDKTVKETLRKAINSATRK